MATKTTTVSEATEILAELKSQIAGKEAILARGNERRRRFAYKASQGDAAASAALEQIVADETAATEAIRNLQLAIETAATERAAAVKRAHETDLHRRERILAKESAALIATDQKVVKAITALHEALEERDETIQCIAELGLLPATTVGALQNQMSIDTAIVGGLGPHFPAYIDPAAKPHAPNDMVSQDCKLIGKPCPLPPREPTPVERELRRQALRTADGFARS